MKGTFHEELVTDPNYLFLLLFLLGTVYLRFTVIPRLTSDPANEFFG